VVATINIAAGDYTHAIQRRAIGKLNIGFYCDCGQFVAFAVTEQNLPPVAYACDGPIEFACPFCGQRQKRVVSEFQTLILTEGNKQKRADPGSTP
jgi:hypothetical protein